MPHMRDANGAVHLVPRHLVLEQGLCRFSTHPFPVVLPPWFHVRVYPVPGKCERDSVARPMSRLQPLVLSIRIDVVPRSTERWFE